MNVIEEKYDWAYPLTPRRATTLLVLHHEAGSGSTAQQIHNYHRYTAVFTCRVAKDDQTAEIDETTFDVTAPGDYRDKKEAWDNRSKYIGKKLTVKYQELTDDGIPRFPVALGIKEDR